MIRCTRILSGLLAFGLFFSFGSVNSRAEEQKEPYKYQITIYAGDQGTITNAREIQVVDADNRPVQNASIITNGDFVRVKDLEPGCRVTFGNAADAGVDLGENSLYYVRGIRKSGYDNSTVGVIEPVYQDQDYVVAYGIRGDMVAYRINYEDASGNTLAPSRTFYGNVGDRPVAAYLYIEGYEPQAYNLTKALSKNEVENVFTFVYTRVSDDQTTGGAGGTGSTGTGTTGTGTAGGGTTAGTGADAVGGTAVGTGAGSAGGGAAGAGAVGGANAAADGEEAADDEAGVAVPDEDVPQDEGPDELIRLDDEEVPLIGNPGLLEGGAVNMLGAMAVSVTAAVMFLGLLIVFVKNRKKAKVKEKE